MVVTDGDAVEPVAVLCVVEAMKMENAVCGRTPASSPSSPSRPASR
jgi:biotin carboxyl carrier protein